MVRAERCWAWLLLLLAVQGVARASGPRYVTGPPFYTGASGVSVRWAQSGLSYYTDPGALSPTVNHQAADALVAAAAGVWNVSVASVTVSRGGALAEHVSSANVYLGTNGMVFPDDVSSGNSAAVPIAVIYDQDGSVTDLLLGLGASDPSGCRQNGVTESVDRFDPAGYILHALIVINGRCSGTAAEAQLQLQYQLERVFGRVLGLAWSQANDNVFTGTPTPTYQQALHWPIMHPLDIICAAYTYQCLPNPFQLRPDDLASLVMLYPNAAGTTLPAGKQVSLGAAVDAFGSIAFPTGQGMAGVNQVVRRGNPSNGSLEPWVAVSAVSGTQVRRNNVSPFVTADTGSLGSQGTWDTTFLGRSTTAYVPLPDGQTSATMVVTTEAINPLYTGTHSVGPYAAGTVSPSGSAPPASSGQVMIGQDLFPYFQVSDAAATCGAGLDGTPSAPAQVAATGWWNGQICPYGHVSYLNLDVRPGRTLTVEATALDENGLATTHKMMPVIGIYAPTDQPTVNLPSIAVAPAAFQALGLGMTTLSASTGQQTRLTVGIGDQRGDGRPDFGFQGRVFYADTVSPERLPVAGGAVTIAGMGFRLGNQVKVNGVTAVVKSWTSTAIVVTMPTMAAAGATDKAAVDVMVSDISTGARSAMTAALTYDTSPTLPNVMKLVSAQQAKAYVNSVAPVAFAVEVVKGDGTTPVAGETVVFSLGNGAAATYAACGAAMCSVRTDAMGMASTGITPTQAGTVMMLAADGVLQQSGSFTAAAGDPGMMLVSAPSGNLANANAATTPFTVQVVGSDGTTGLDQRRVTFAVTSGAATLSGCFQATCVMTTSWLGYASVTVTPTRVGPVTVTATDGALVKTATFNSVDIPDLMQIARQPSGSVGVGSTTAFGILLLHPDGSTPDTFQPVTFTATGGATVYPCKAASCTVNTGADGTALVSIGSTTAGSVTLIATFGAAAQTASLTFTPVTGKMMVLSAPTGAQAVGVPTDRPFTVQVLQADGTPVSGQRMALNGPTDQVRLGACNLGGCIVNTDGHGVVSTTVTPLRAGPIVVTAQFTSLNQTITFSATGASKTMNVLAAPPATSYTGDLQNFEIQVIQPDGVTPAAGDQIIMAVTGGNFTFSGWNTATAYGATDGMGRLGGSGIAYAPGPVTILVSDGAVTQTISFTTALRTESLAVVSAPSGIVTLGTAVSTPFAVRVTQADAVTPVAGRAVTFTVTAGDAGLSACGGGGSCAVNTDANGLAAVTVTPGAVGTVTVVASDGGLQQVATVNVVGQDDVLKLVSSPESSATVGTQETTTFAVRAFLSDGTTPAVGRTVVFSTTVGSVEFGVCGSTTCTVTTGSDGRASTTVTPLTAGAITLLAVDGTQTQTATVNAVAKANKISVVSSPGSSVFVGTTATTAFAVKVTLADGTTPVSGTNVTFANGGAGGGAVQFVACGAATCVVSTDSTGVAATTVAGVTVGAATLVATVTPSTGAQSVTVPIQVVSDQESVNASNPVTYLAEGTTFAATLEATATLNGTPGLGTVLTWTAGVGITLSGGTSATDARGAARMQASMGPLAAGGAATATACASTSACATFTAIGVSGSNLLIALVSGGQQEASVGAVAPVVAAVSDTAGHVIAGAQVTVYQTVTAAAVACPTKGRCPAAPVLATKVSVLSTDSNGVVSLVPLVVNGTATETKLLLTVGTRGTATAEVWNRP